MSVNYLFEINSVYRSTDKITYGGHNYTPTIISESFDGIKMRHNLDGYLITPNDIDFEISDPTGTLTRSDLEGYVCTVTKITDGSLDRAWAFKVKRAVPYYKKWKCYCVGLLQEFLTGQWPNTAHPFELWPSDDIDLDNLDDMCVPVVLGTGYVPVMSVNTGSARYYVIGDTTVPTYTISEVQSPHGWNEAPTKFASGSFTFNQSNDSGHKLAQFLIHNPSKDGATYYNGLYPTGSGFHPVLCKMSRSDTSALTSPEEWIEYILKDFGIASGYIDTGVGSSFEAAGAVYSARSQTFNGGFWKKENREAILISLLKQCDSVLVVTDKIELHPFSATSVETLSSADIIIDSFTPSMLTRTNDDGGRVQWPESNEPQDVFPGKAIVPLYDAQASIDAPTSDVLSFRFSSNSVHAQTAAILAFAKKFLQADRIEFSTECSKITNINTLLPAQVLTINDSLYGASFDVVIEDIDFKPDNSVDISCVRLEHTEDWSDQSQSSVAVTSDSSTGFNTPDSTTDNMHYITVGPNDGDAMYSDLEAALGALGSGAAKLFIRNGSYTMAGKFTLPSYDTEIIGESKNGVSISLGSDTHMFEKASDTDVQYVFKNMTFNMYSGVDKTTAGRVINAKNTTCDLTVENCVFNLWDDGSYNGDGDSGVYYGIGTGTAGSAILRINGCTFNGGGIGAHNFKSGHVYIKDSYFNDQTSYGVYCAECVFAEVTGNVIAGAYALGILAINPTDTNISKNKITMRGGISHYSIGIEVDDNGSASIVKVNNNEIRIGSRTGAIHVYGIALAGYTSGYTVGWECSNNYIYVDGWLNPSYTGTGILTSYLYVSTICNNVIHMDLGNTGTVSYGIHLTSNSDRNSIANNNIYNDDALTGDTAIEIDSGCDYNNGENMSVSWTTDLDDNGANNTVTVVTS